MLPRRAPARRLAPTQGLAAVEIEAQCESDTLRLAIANGGQELTPEAGQLIFEPFQRGRPCGTDDTEVSRLSLHRSGSD